MNVVFESPGIWFVRLGKFWLDNGRLFIWTFHRTVNSCDIVVCFRWLLTSNESWLFLNLAACRLAVYWSVFQNVHSCPRKSLTSLEWCVATAYCTLGVLFLCECSVRRKAVAWMSHYIHTPSTQLCHSYVACSHTYEHSETYVSMPEIVNRIWAVGMHVSACTLNSCCVVECIYELYVFSSSVATSSAECNHCSPPSSLVCGQLLPLSVGSLPPPSKCTSSRSAHEFQGSQLRSWPTDQYANCIFSSGPLSLILRAW